MNTGVSKKLCIAALGIHSISGMANDTNYLWCIAGIVGICVVYKIVQGFIDWKK